MSKIFLLSQRKEKNFSWKQTPKVYIFCLHGTKRSGILKPVLVVSIFLTINNLISNYIHRKEKYKQCSAWKHITFFLTSGILKVNFKLVYMILFLWSIYLMIKYPLCISYNAKHFLDQKPGVPWKVNFSVETSFYLKIIIISGSMWMFAWDSLVADNSEDRHICLWCFRKLLVAVIDKLDLKTSVYLSNFCRSSFFLLSKQSLFKSIASTFFFFYPLFLYTQNFKLLLLFKFQWGIRTKFEFQIFAKSCATKTIAFRNKSCGDNPTDLVEVWKQLKLAGGSVWYWNSPLYIVK